jgi:hypothetical protein
MTLSRGKATWIDAIVRPCTARSRLSPKKVAREWRRSESSTTAPKRIVTSTDAAPSAFAS